MKSIASALAMLFGESRRRYPAQTAVGPNLVEVAAPIPEPPTGMRDLDDLAVQFSVQRILLERMAVAISA